MTAATVWTAVLASYDNDGLVTLTNGRDRSATTVLTAAGQNAAQGVIDLWPAYAQEAFDATDALHLEVAKRGTIAMLWSRGGTSSTIAKVEWDEVFAEGGLISRVRKTGARARSGPTSNSGVSQRAEAEGGRSVRGWSDRDALPVNYMPLRRTADEG